MMDEPIGMTGHHPAKCWHRLEASRDFRLGSRKLIIAACLALWGVCTPAHAQPERGETRGELLYLEHCSSCHTSAVHWREKTLVTDWRSLEAQVRRWQGNIGLGWSEDEITDVARYLNTTFYHFPVTDKKNLAEGSKSQPVNAP